MLCGVMKPPLPSVAPAPLLSGVVIYSLQCTIQGPLCVNENNGHNVATEKNYRQQAIDERRNLIQIKKKKEEEEEENSTKPNE